MTKEESKQLQTNATAQLLTKSGLKLNVRTALPDDEQSVLDLLKSVSPDDLRFRFLDAVRPSQALARMLTRVDPREVENLVAFDSSNSRLASTAMIARQSAETAEVAIVVRSDLKGRGIGWAMLSYACEVARARGFVRVQCIESSANRAALSLETEQGFGTIPSADDATVIILSKELA